MTHYNFDLTNNPYLSDLIMTINAIQHMASTMTSSDGKASADFAKRFSHRHDLSKDDCFNLLLDIKGLIDNFNRRPKKSTFDGDYELPFTF